jgi:hypothetical protein
MMTNDDVPRGMPYPQGQGRKPLPPNSRYGPSPSYNYNYNTNASFPSQQQHMRRKMERFKRDNGNLSERLMRQNDLIIRLLKEIRDRLPPPPVSAAAGGSDAVAARQNRPFEGAPPQEIQAPAPEESGQAASAPVDETPRTGQPQPAEENREGE